MATKFISFKFIAGKSENSLSKMIKNFDFIHRGIKAALEKINKKEILTAYKDAMVDRLKEFNVRFGKRLDDVIDRFKASKTSLGNKTSMVIKYDDNSDIEFNYKSSHITGLSIVKILNRGRKNYLIPSIKNNTAKPLLVWRYGKRRMMWEWKTMGRIKVLKKNSDPYRHGTYFIDAGIDAVDTYIESIREEIRSKMKRKP